jgi:branched-subunit amino acid transport protein AzlD
MPGCCVKFLRFSTLKPFKLLGIENFGNEAILVIGILFATLRKPDNALAPIPAPTILNGSATISAARPKVLFNLPSGNLLLSTTSPGVLYLLLVNYFRYFWQFFP